MPLNADEAATWTGHHRLFPDVAQLSRPLTWLNIGWALSIVFLQLPSAMIYQLPTDRWGPVLYAATLLVSQLMLTPDPVVARGRQHVVGRAE
ncbi:MAG TPA: hypothetical protein VIL68_14105 [Propionibacteriaceae bacterium]|jgi:uncharacterized membrane protein